MSEFPLEDKKVSAAVEASDLLRQLASPAPAGAHIETLIRGVARRLGWAHSRTRDVWYGNARRIDAEEMDVLRKVAAKRSGNEARNSDTVVVDRKYFEQVQASLAELHRKVDALQSRAPLAETRKARRVA